MFSTKFHYFLFIKQRLTSACRSRSISKLSLTNSQCEYGCATSSPVYQLARDGAILQQSSSFAVAYSSYIQTDIAQCNNVNVLFVCCLSFRAHSSLLKLLSKLTHQS